MLAWKQLADFLKNSQNFGGKTQFSIPKKLTENPKTEYLSTFVDRGRQKSAQKISLSMQYWKAEKFSTFYNSV